MPNNKNTVPRKKRTNKKSTPSRNRIRPTDSDEEDCSLKNYFDPALQKAVRNSDADSNRNAAIVAKARKRFEKLGDLPMVDAGMIGLLVATGAEKLVRSKGVSVGSVKLTLDQKIDRVIELVSRCQWRIELAKECWSLGLMEDVSDGFVGGVVGKEEEMFKKVESNIAKDGFLDFKKGLTMLYPSPPKSPKSGTAHEKGSKEHQKRYNALREFMSDQLAWEVPELIGWNANESRRSNRKRMLPSIMSRIGNRIDWIAIPPGCCIINLLKGAEIPRISQSGVVFARLDDFLNQPEEVCSWALTESLQFLEITGWRSTHDFLNWRRAFVEWRRIQNLPARKAAGEASAVRSRGKVR